MIEYAAMKIVYLASEATPFAKTGGLADVAGALPKFLPKLGLEVRLFLPFYREVRKKNLALRKILEDLSSGLGRPQGKILRLAGLRRLRVCLFYRKRRMVRPRLPLRDTGR